MPGFLTDAQVTSALLDQLQKTNATGTATLESWWAGIVTRANAWAYGEIRRRLAARGYLLSQITAWDDGAEFQTDLALWKALTIAAARQPGTYSAQGVQELDRRKELTGSSKEDIRPVQLTAAGVFQDPLGTAGQVSTGAFDQSADEFVWPDPLDPRIGQVTEI